MHRIPYQLLQITPGRQASFVIYAGLLVMALTLFIVFQGILTRLRKKKLLLEKQLQEERFEARLLENRLQVQALTFDSIGKELHDNIGQLLSTAKMLIGITENETQSPPSTLISANNTLDRAIAELRSLSNLFDKEWMEGFDLYRHLDKVIAEINAGGKLWIDIFRKGHLLPATPERQFTLLRIIQEGIQNVLKHAAAQKLSIRIFYDDQMLITELQDDGKGFDTNSHSKGLGIKHMRERVRWLGGKINFTSQPGRTLVYIELPMEKFTA